jgi:hypothetical protein
MMEALPSSETSVSTRAKRRNMPEDDLLPIGDLLLSGDSVSFCWAHVNKTESSIRKVVFRNKRHPDG